NVVFQWNSEPPISSKSVFFDSVSKLVELAQKSNATAEMVHLHKDKLTYFRELLESGELEQKELWPLAENLTKAKRDAKNDLHTYNVALESMAREWGGDQWWLLMDLLEEYTNVKRPLLP
ncbi:MAG: hypothetical protein GY727_12330, partial [Gammaproteobacteria bacterium]|nr:hypothetical protein [Gammaproteobacteria bacterium]